MSLPSLVRLSCFSAWLLGWAYASANFLGNKGNKTRLQEEESEDQILLPAFVVAESELLGYGRYPAGFMATPGPTLGDQAHNPTPTLGPTAGDEAHWNRWKRTFGNMLATPVDDWSAEEERKRFAIFSDNMKTAAALTQEAADIAKRSGSSDPARFGDTKFSHLTPEEFKSQRLSARVSSFGGVLASHAVEKRIPEIEKAKPTESPATSSNLTTLKGFKAAPGAPCDKNHPYDSSQCNTEAGYYCHGDGKCWNTCDNNHPETFCPDRWTCSAFGEQGWCKKTCGFDGGTQCDPTRGGVCMDGGCNGQTCDADPKLRYDPSQCNTEAGYYCHGDGKCWNTCDNNHLETFCPDHWTCSAFGEQGWCKKSCGFDGGTQCDPSKASALQCVGLLGQCMAQDIDWRTKGAITPVKDQVIGTCVAFSAVEQIESAYYIHSSSLLELSVQQVVSCNCHGGGYPLEIFKNGCLMRDGSKVHGLSLASEYPYTMDWSGCNLSHNLARPVVAVLGGSQVASEHEMFLQIQKSPMSVQVDASAGSAFQLYEGGVLSVSQCGDGSKKGVHHAVQVVGFGSGSPDTGGPGPYWIVRNSWGKDWGEGGYIRLQADANTCGIARAASIVSVGSA